MYSVNQKSATPRVLVGDQDLIKLNKAVSDLYSLKQTMERSQINKSVEIRYKLNKIKIAVELLRMTKNDGVNPLVVPALVKIAPHCREATLCLLWVDVVELCMNLPGFKTEEFEHSIRNAAKQMKAEMNFFGDTKIQSLINNLPDRGDSFDPAKPTDQYPLSSSPTMEPVPASRSPGQQLSWQASSKSNRKGEVSAGAVVNPLPDGCDMIGQAVDISDDIELFIAIQASYSSAQSACKMRDPSGNPQLSPDSTPDHLQPRMSPVLYSKRSTLPLMPPTAMSAPTSLNQILDAYVAEGHPAESADRERVRETLQKANATLETDGTIGIPGNLELHGFKTLTSLPANLKKVDGNLSIEACHQLLTLPDGLQVDGNLVISHCANFILLGNLTILGHLMLHKCMNLESLPPEVGACGDLTIDACHNLVSLPTKLVVNGDLRLIRCFGLTLPQGLTVIGNLSIKACNLRTLADDLTVHQTLHISKCANLTTLPDHFTVDGDLTVIDCPNFTHFPTGIKKSEPMDQDERTITLINTGLSDDSMNELRSAKIPGMRFVFAPVAISAPTSLNQILDQYVAEGHPNESTDRKRVKNLIQNANATLETDGTIRVPGELVLRDFKQITRLPANLKKVDGNLSIRSCAELTTLGPNLIIGGSLRITKCAQLTTLFGRIQVEDTLHISDCDKFNQLPDNLVLDGHLELHRCPAITHLPECIFTLGRRKGDQYRKIHIDTTGLPRVIVNRLNGRRFIDPLVWIRIGHENPYAKHLMKPTEEHPAVPLIKGRPFNPVLARNSFLKQEARMKRESACVIT